MDTSVYDTDPPTVVNPTVEIKVPGFNAVYLPFTVEQINTFNSTDLGLTTAGDEIALPDGIYCIKYTTDPVLTNFVEKSIIRVDKLQEKFDNAFMTLDIMECDDALKKQAIVSLNTIYFYLQGSIASANNCAYVEAAKLYGQANKMLDRFLASHCGCSGNNYLVNFQ